MNSYLLYPDKDGTGEAVYPSFHDMYKDLNLNIVLKTMARDDVFMMEQIRNVMMVPLCRASEVEYRYEIIRDFQQNPELAGELYSLGVKGYKLARQYKEEMEQDRRKATIKTSAIIASLNFIEDSMGLIRTLRELLQRKEIHLNSKGMTGLVQRLSHYPLEDFLDFHKNFLFYTTGGEGIFSIRISGGLKLSESRLKKCQNYHYHALKGTSFTFMKLYYKLAKKDSILIEKEQLEKDIGVFVESHMLQITAAYQPLINDCVKFLFQFARETSFYQGVYTMQRRMQELQLPLCYGSVSENTCHRHTEDLYELSLALYTQTYPVPNSIHTEGKILTVITGANQGGKSTFLRSFGIAQVLLQCGMPVPAKEFCSKIYSRIHTHFTRKEDAMLSRGRLEEELRRMSDIITQLSPDSLLLLNESFASTTEKEGAQIAYNIILPLYEKGIHVMMVTHLHEFALRLYDENRGGSEFLVAERKKNGERTFHMLSGKPHYSSYGTDLYEYMIGSL